MSQCVEFLRLSSPIVVRVAGPSIHLHNHGFLACETLHLEKVFFQMHGC